MTGIWMSTDFDDKSLSAALQGMMRRLSDTRSVMDEIGGMLVKSTLDRFERQRGPDGRAWTPSLRVGQTGGQTLSHTGRLCDSITHRAASDAAFVGTNVVYAALHQFGGKTKPGTPSTQSAEGLVLGRGCASGTQCAASGVGYTGPALSGGQS